MDKSVFSKIIDGEIPATVYYEDERFIAIKDINGQAPVHALIISKKPYKTLEEIPSDDVEFHAQLLLTARNVAKQLNIADNYKLFLNVGERVQSVHHLHLHLMGGWANDKTREQLDQEALKVINQ
ncbi:MAG: HIT domain-containing protein [bacterium]|nr:HIT domain-containing protein [bacterium]